MYSYASPSEEAMNAQRGKRIIALIFLYSCRYGVDGQCHYLAALPPGKKSVTVLLVQTVEWAPGPGAENLRLLGIRCPNRKFVPSYQTLFRPTYIHVHDVNILVNNSLIAGTSSLSGSFPYYAQRK